MQMLMAKFIVKPKKIEGLKLLEWVPFESWNYSHLTFLLAFVNQNFDLKFYIFFLSYFIKINYEYLKIFLIPK